MIKKAAQVSDDELDNMKNKKRKSKSIDIENRLFLRAVFDKLYEIPKNTNYQNSPEPKKINNFDTQFPEKIS